MNKAIAISVYIAICILNTPTHAKDDNLIKTKCYKTEDPVGEVCLFEDRKAVSTNKEKYQQTCEDAAKLSIKTISQPELRVTDSNGTESNRVKIEYLSELNLVKLRVAGKKTFYTSYENTYCGVSRGSENTPFWVSDGKINYLKIDNKEKSFMSTLMKSWSAVNDGFLEAVSEPFKKGEDVAWKTSYTRYQYLNRVWVIRKKVTPEMTQFEELPNEKDFPARAKQ
jgi:hypothetical protein